MILKNCEACQQTESTQSFNPCNPCDCDCHKTDVNETARKQAERLAHRHLLQITTSETTREQRALDFIVMRSPGLVENAAWNTILARLIDFADREAFVAIADERKRIADELDPIYLLGDRTKLLNFLTKLRGDK